MIHSTNVIISKSGSVTSNTLINCDKSSKLFSSFKTDSAGRRYLGPNQHKDGQICDGEVGKMEKWSCGHTTERGGTGD